MAAVSRFNISTSPWLLCGTNSAAMPGRHSSRCVSTVSNSRLLNLKGENLKSRATSRRNFNSSFITHSNNSKLCSLLQRVVTTRREDVGTCRANLDALIFDCDGVILESENLHREAYNLTFEHFSIKCGPQLVQWDTEFYDVLQNTIGGGKPKMRWYFNKNGWPSSTILGSPPKDENDQAILIDTLQDWKTDKYKALISSGAEPRPGVLDLMDEASSLGIKVAVCSAATKSSVVFCLNNLLGKERFDKLDCFLAGDDVKHKKPDPSIYKVAAEKLGAEPGSCLVVEDSVIGLKAALGAGMNCIITYTSSTAKQDFTGATATYSSLGGVSLKELITRVEAGAALI